jgi:hypothetical protein
MIPHEDCNREAQERQGARGVRGPRHLEAALFRPKAGHYLAINGVRLAATAEEAYAFIADLYPTNGFNFDVLVPWLRLVSS